MKNTEFKLNVNDVFTNQQNGESCYDIIVPNHKEHKFTVYEVFCSQPVGPKASFRTLKEAEDYVNNTEEKEDEEEEEKEFFIEVANDGSFVIVSGITSSEKESEEFDIYSSYSLIAQNIDQAVCQLSLLLDKPVIHNDKVYRP